MPYAIAAPREGSGAARDSRRGGESRGRPGVEESLGDLLRALASLMVDVTAEPSARIAGEWGAGGGAGRQRHTARTALGSACPCLFRLAPPEVGLRFDRTPCCSTPKTLLKRCTSAVSGFPRCGWAGESNQNLMLGTQHRAGHTGILPCPPPPFLTPPLGPRDIPPFASTLYVFGRFAVFALSFQAATFPVSMLLLFVLAFPLSMLPSPFSSSPPTSFAGADSSVLHEGTCRRHRLLPAELPLRRLRIFFCAGRSEKSFPSAIASLSRPRRRTDQQQ